MRVSEQSIWINLNLFFNLLSLPSSICHPNVLHWINRRCCTKLKWRNKLNFSYGNRLDEEFNKIVFNHVVFIKSSNANYRISRSRSRSFATTLTVRTGGDISKLYNINFWLIFLHFFPPSSSMYTKKMSAVGKYKRCTFIAGMPDTNWTSSYRCQHILFAAAKVLCKCSQFIVYSVFEVCGEVKKE